MFIVYFLLDIKLRVNNRSILITNNADNFKKSYCQKTIDKQSKLKRLSIFQRDEFNQSEIEKFPEDLVFVRGISSNSY